MDIVKKKKKKFYKNKNIIVASIVIIFLALIFVSTQAKIGGHSVSSTDIITAKVKRGDLSVKVSGTGILASRDIRWIASNVEGKVERILVKPGAHVEKDELILELINPELEQETKELKWELDSMEAEVRALQERQKTRLLEAKAELLDNQMTYDQEKIRLDAENQLIHKGNATISMLDFKSRKLTVAKLEKTLEMDKARLQQLELTLKAEYEAQISLLNRQRNRYQRSQEQLISLNVTAPVSGVLQLMPLELGQRVLIGDNIAKFAKKGDLIAELNVPEFNASDVSIGQKVNVNTRFNNINGVVMRIDPAVVDGTIQVDVELKGELPNEVRPDLTIDGEIIVAEQTDTLYVRRPAFSQANKTMSIFKLDDDNYYAEQTKVQFGVSSSLDIEVLSGVSEGDSIIVSEVSEFENYNKVKIN